ncbi:MAG: MSHA biogenesis protein MshJ [Burkholderiales bacterium RIFCSPLOWO2_02_FULL_57_36]|nr:MAG: MSHA biogenesis protein MshJ [Burkholderiales bacterium RIFCSPLOWO2_02_FULL_57_36]
MKQYWQKLAQKIDALSLRERVIIFTMLAVLFITAFNAALLDRQFRKQKQLSDQVNAGQAQINLIGIQIQQAVQKKNDPDAANRERLQTLKQQSAQMQSVLLDMQKGLVSPDKMTVLLEDILRRDRKLRLLSLKTLPAASLDESTAADTGKKPSAASIAAVKNIGESEPATGAVYKHGVEIVIQGEYLDILDYMAALEAMPWQLFWGKAILKVNEHPTATLTLTLFTLSLDKKWLNL